MRAISCKDIGRVLGIQAQSVTRAIEPAVDKIARLKIEYPLEVDAMIMERIRQLRIEDPKRALYSQIGICDN
jgi:hypothetical protein